MPLKTITLTYKGRGVFRTRQKLSLRKGQVVCTYLQDSNVNPVSRTAGMFRVDRRTARTIIYSDEAEFFGT